MEVTLHGPGINIPIISKNKEVPEVEIMEAIHNWIGTDQEYGIGVLEFKPVAEGVEVWWVQLPESKNITWRVLDITPTKTTEEKVVILQKHFTADSPEPTGKQPAILNTYSWKNLTSYLRTSTVKEKELLKIIQEVIPLKSDRLGMTDEELQDLPPLGTILDLMSEVIETKAALVSLISICILKEKQS